MTNDIHRRLDEHNAGTQAYSHRYAPWKLITHVVFSERSVAYEFEKYLKTPSGKAFLIKQLVLAESSSVLFSMTAGDAYGSLSL
ncbi:MAG: GIY-YIG nuclease family protein [Verrucomicrobia bacterium]|nr:GIY-YIG nuclease family protein [Verrucomicrobiota bacterium]MCG2678497.1 GIY-YIG nuclease family protein [Kiritimatiellia bacterium]MBU4248003.1 GIY-YIG nuclease family protein [Verrucomicrobiota bacterium]MBU4289590.1 GIY-YIG nuclease family protein [Verrucomicrobiota bacterium]MBU4427742.1 GIY-YIG nuclease family protein [Verrucomicrobiota bacterium]